MMRIQSYKPIEPETSCAYCKNLSKGSQVCKKKKQIVRTPILTSCNDDRHLKKVVVIHG